MLISELIEKLKERLETHGDIPVKLWKGYDCELSDIDNVFSDEDSQNNNQKYINLW